MQMEGLVSEDKVQGTLLRRSEGGTVYEFSKDAWNCREQRQAECVAARACEAYAQTGRPVGNNGVIPVRLDKVKNRHQCLVRANGYLVRLSIRDGRVIAIASVKIANLP